MKQRLKTIEKNSEIKSLFLKKILIDLQPDSSRKKRGIKTDKIRNDKVVTIDIIQVQAIIREDYKQLKANKLGHLQEMDTFLEA